MAESRLTGAPGAGSVPQGAAGPAAHERGAARRVPGAEVDVRRAAAPAGPRGRPRRGDADLRRQPRYERGGRGRCRAFPRCVPLPGLSPLCSRAEPPRMAGARRPQRKGPGPADTCAPFGLVFIVFSSEGAGGGCLQYLCCLL